MDDPACKYTEARLTAIEARLSDWILESRRQIDKAEITLSQRLEHLNRLREEIVSDRIYYLRIDAYETRHNELMRQIKAIDDFTNNLRGRMWAGGVILSVALTVMTIIVSLAVKYF